jgi:DNA-binding LacI/PurR family transcriptional regulator
VVLGNNIVEERRQADFDVVWSDDIQGAHEMTRHLQSLGHQEIWFVGNCRLPWFSRCYSGYRQAMEEAGLTTHLCEFDSRDQKVNGYLATKWILTQGKAATAIFAGTDECAQGVYRALRDSGRRIPEDMSVAGFNDTYASVLHPVLTTVREFPDQLGMRMVELLLKRIAHPDIPPQHLTIPTELVRGESCGRLHSTLLTVPSQAPGEKLTQPLAPGS